VTEGSSTTPVQRVQTKGIFYGYWIVAAGSIVAAVNGALYFYGFGAFFKFIIDELGTSRAVMSGAFSLARLEGGLIGPIEGWLIDKFGPRKVMFVGIPMLAAGFFLMSAVNSIIMFYAVFVLLLSLGSAFSSVAPVSTAVANWFNRKRSAMLGITLAGVGAGSAIVPVVTLLITYLGWRQALVVLGFVILIIGFPVAALVRHKPEQYGYYPDNEEPEPASPPADSDSAHSTVADEEGLTAKEALRTSAFWFMAFAFSLRVGVTSAVAIHFIPFLTDIGLSLNTAGLMVSLLGIVGIVGRLGFGWLGDIAFFTFAALCTVAIPLIMVAKKPAPKSSVQVATV